MDIEKIKKLTDQVVATVDHLDSPYNAEAFRIIFNDLYHLENSPETKSFGKPEIKSDVSQSSNNKKILADNCGITLEQLDDILVIDKNSVQLLVQFSGSNAEKQIKLSQCILTVFELSLQQNWTSSDVLSNSLRSSGISLDHLARTLRKNQQFFRVRGRGKGKNLECKVTELGKNNAYSLIQKLAKGEFV